MSPQLKFHKSFSQQLTHTCNSKKTYPTTTLNSRGMILILSFPKFPKDGSQFYERHQTESPQIFSYNMLIVDISIKSIFTLHYTWTAGPHINDFRENTSQRPKTCFEALNIAMVATPHHNAKGASVLLLVASRIHHVISPGDHTL
jgi:hypothetical protein